MNNDQQIEGGEEAAAEPVTVDTSRALDSNEVPTLTLTVEGHCRYSKGLFVSINMAQRNTLGVNETGVVELFQDGQSLGWYSVLKGRKHLIGTNRLCANAVNPESEVVLKPVAPNSAIKLPVFFRIEASDQDSHLKRSTIIRNKFPSLDSESYLVVPTSIGRRLGFEQGSKPTLLKLSLGVVKFQGKEFKIPIVPAGNNVSFTTAAAQQMGIGDEIVQKGLSEISIRVENGVLFLG